MPRHARLAVSVVGVVGVVGLGFAALAAAQAPATAAAPAPDDRRAVIALIAQAPGAIESWAEAEGLVAQLASADRGVAGAAGRALVIIARRYGVDGAQDPARAGWTADARAESAASLATLAARPEVFAEVRVHALEAAVLLGDVTLAARLAGDGDPELRRAAVAWLDPARAADAARLGEVARSDADDGVAATAAAVLCRAGQGPAGLDARAAALAAAADRGDAPALAKCLR